MVAVGDARAIEVGLLRCVTVVEADAAGVAPGEARAGLEADNARLRWQVAVLRTANTRLAGREAVLGAQVVELVERQAELEALAAELATLRRIVFGRSSERAGGTSPAPGGHTGTDDAGATVDGGGGSDERTGVRGHRGDAAGGGGSGRRGPGAWAARRDYGHLDRAERDCDFPDGTCLWGQCGESYAPLGERVLEQLDWQVRVILRVSRRRPPRQVQRLR